MTVNSRASAAALLSAYLSALLRAEIRVPMLVDEQKPLHVGMGSFIDMLPKVVQRAVDGAELLFDLPLVASGKGTSLSPQVAEMVNALLHDTGPHDLIEVPTFFYSDGSTMVIAISKGRLGNAITLLTQSKAIAEYVCNVVSDTISNRARG